jgi:hypothetical protein
MVIRRSGVSSLLVVLLARSAIAGEPREVRTTKAFVHGNRDDLELESPETGSDGASRWTKVCSLPCSGLHLSLAPPYRVVGSEVLPSDPFQLLPTSESQVVNVLATPLSDRNTARGLFIGGLVGVGVGALAIGSAAIVLANAGSSRTGEQPFNDAFTAGAIAGLFGVAVVLSGVIVAIIGGIKLANARTSVSVEARSADPNWADPSKPW